MFPKEKKGTATIANLIRTLYGWACERLYHEFAWGYDITSWFVSAGRWHTWRGAALDYVIGPSVLELGFGTGELLIQCAQQNLDSGLDATVHPRRWLSSGAYRSQGGAERLCLDIHGIDLSPQMHGIAKAKIQRLLQQRQAHDHFNSVTLNRVHLVQARAQTLPYPDGYFQTIVSTFPAPYILDPQTLRECTRVLAPAIQPGKDSPPKDSAKRTSTKRANAKKNTGGRLVIVGMWVSPRQAHSTHWTGWLQRLPVFFGAPDEGEIQALATPFRAAGLEPTFETFSDRWADVSVIVAERVS